MPIYFTLKRFIVVSLIAIGIILSRISSVLSENFHHPVIFLAGYMGTQLKYQLHKANTSPFFCQKNLYTTRSLWLDAYQAFSPVKKYCWLHYLSLEYDPWTRSTKSPPGVQILVPPMGDTQSIEYISPFPFQVRPTEYYINIINSLERLGYSRGYNIFGAPYDWRKSPHEQGDFFESLRYLVQEIYEKNGGKRVILFGHSMGGNFAYLFLRKQNVYWKNHYIRAVVFAASPWGGNFKHMYDYLYEDDFAADLIPEFRQVERTYSSLAFLLPNKRIWGPDDIFLTTPTADYTAFNMEEYFAHLNHPNGYQMYLDTKDLMDPFVHPEVDIYCIPAVGYKTLRQVEMFSDNDKTNRFTNYSQGDGFVNIESALGCLNWFPSKKYKFYLKLLDSSHLGMLRETEPVNFFANLIYSLP
ncbi:group XV phospholipase A2-like [Tetranychus urticae]|uniref:group XV phospholipase A2-like n=1 Tax=Tetranychus urticae TaxID=32264 RepID=UPI000D65D7E5|nr:group XV phospholipase A2-like [Tetranychus urticae]